MAKSKFFEKIKDAKIERSVEDVYNEGINLYFPTEKGIEYPFACDGFVDTKTNNGKILKLIIEYKFDEMMSNSVTRAKVLVQVIYYIKKFEQNGMILPNVCMVSDKNECFVMHTNCLLKYLDEKIDWEISPSTAAAANPDLVLKISKDDEINPFIFNVDNDFSFKAVADKIKDLADNIKRYVRVTEHNISKIFDYFCKNVVKNGNKMKGQDLVEIFMGVIGDKENYYLHPVKPNTLVCGKKDIAVNGKRFESFFSYFEHNYTPQETMRLKSIADRLIHDADRRNSGDFWTPTLFVDKAHEMISNALGEDWKEQYVVWDPAWGAGNLTRDYKFKNLYCSTLYQSELNIGAEYNSEASKFQFDFLNDEITSKDSIFGIYNDNLPKGLKEALMEDKPIVFFLNPPYAQASNGKSDSGSKKDVAKTMINKTMLDNNVGSVSQNLYAQFLYHILLIKKTFDLTNCHIAIFSPARFLSGGSFKKFRKVFLNDFTFDDGILFNASNFDACSDKWAISFSIWHNGKSANKNIFKYTLVENKDGEVSKCGDKTIYNIDGKVSASDWAKESIKKLKTFDCPNLKSCINIGEKNTRGKLFNNALGYFYNAGNNVDNNIRCVGIFSSAFSNGNGYGINDSNFAKCMALFSARKLIMTNWIQNTDEYLAPNESNEHYNEFVNDSIIYSLFQSNSNQSSLRNIDYKGKKWDVKNEFFWMSKKTIEDLANENYFSYTYNDARTSDERYVYNKLHTITLSPEAKKVLDKANEIVINTFKYREMFNTEHPEYQIMNWDCGWAQIKVLAKEYDKVEYDEFVKLFKDLENKMRPMVYELGFLIA